MRTDADLSKDPYFRAFTDALALALSTAGVARKSTPQATRPPAPPATVRTHPDATHRVQEPAPQ